MLEQEPRERRAFPRRAAAILARAATPVPIFTGVLLMLGAGLGALAVTLRGWPGGVPWYTVPGFLALLVTALSLVIRVQYRGQTMVIDLFEAVLAGAIVTLPSPIVLGLTVAALIAVETAHHNRRAKTAFNVAQWMAAAGVGALLFALLRGPDPTSARSMAALLLAMTSVALVNTLAFSFVIKLVEGQPLRRVMKSLAPTIVIGWAANTSFGIMLVVAYAWSPFALALFLMLLLMLHGAHRGYAAAISDRARISGMHRATGRLTSQVRARDAIMPFLEEVRRCFDAEAADLLLIEGNGLTIYRAREGRDAEMVEPAPDQPTQLLLVRARPERITRRHAEGALADAMVLNGWHECLAAPLASDRGVSGMLCVYNRSGMAGFEQAELNVLEALGAEAASAIEKDMLLEAVFEERRKLAEIVDHTSDGIVSVSRDGAIATWNPAMGRITGRDARDVLGRQIAEVLGAPLIPLESWATGPALPSEVEIRGAGGERRRLWLSYTRLLDADGQPYRLLVMSRDATRAREVDRLKDELTGTVAGLSHELRSPLTTIMGWTNILIKHGERLDEQTRAEGLHSVLRHSVRLERLVTNMLELSKLERGIESSDIGVIEIAPLIGTLVDEIRMAEPDRSIEFVHANGQSHVVGDDVSVQQIVTNLLSNAIKYSPPEEPIKVLVEGMNGTVSVSVIDRGPGIPVHQVETIFGEFVRLSDHLTRSKSGAGLGLHIARRLAESIGATLGVACEPGGGSRFTLTLRGVTEHVRV